MYARHCVWLCFLFSNFRCIVVWCCRSVLSCACDSEVMRLLLAQSRLPDWLLITWGSLITMCRGSTCDCAVATRTYVASNWTYCVQPPASGRACPTRPAVHSFSKLLQCFSFCFLLAVAMDWWWNPRESKHHHPPIPSADTRCQPHFTGVLLPLSPSNNMVEMSASVRYRWNNSEELAAPHRVVAMNAPCATTEIVKSCRPPPTWLRWTPLAPPRK